MTMCRWQSLAIVIAYTENTHMVFARKAAGRATIRHQNAIGVKFQRINASTLQEFGGTPWFPDYWRSAAATFHIEQLWIKPP